MSQFTSSERARLDQVIAKQFSVSVSVAKQFIAEGKVKLAGKPARKGDLVEPGQEISTTGEPHRNEAFVITPQPELPLVVVYEDDDLVALDKPSGIPTHPLAAEERGTLANALVARFPMCAQSSEDHREAGIAHRLDIETSGILLAAKNKETFVALRRMFSSHQVTKMYLAAVSGAIEQPIEICERIAHDPKNQKKAVVMPEGRLAKRYHAQEALTQIEPISVVFPSVIPAEAGIHPDPSRMDPRVKPEGDVRFALGETREYTIIQATTIFGRMHQVRVHLAHIGHPLLGDVLYGGSPQTLSSRSFFLHAYTLRLMHPTSQKELLIQTKEPPELALFSR